MTINNIYGVVVVFNCAYRKSKTIQTLNSSLKKLSLKLDLLIYDNSLKQDSKAESLHFENLSIKIIHTPGASSANNNSLDNVFSRN